MAKKPIHQVSHEVKEGLQRAHALHARADSVHQRADAVHQKAKNIHAQITAMKDRAVSARQSAKKSPRRAG